MFYSIDYYVPFCKIKAAWHRQKLIISIKILNVCVYNYYQVQTCLVFAETVTIDCSIICFQRCAQSCPHLRRLYYYCMWPILRKAMYLPYNTSCRISRMATQVMNWDVSEVWLWVCWWVEYKHRSYRFFRLFL